MNGTLTTVVKRLIVVGGVRQLDEELLFDVPTRSEMAPKPSKGSLLVLVGMEVSGEVQQSVRESVFQSYYRDSSLSVTSSLMRAIRRAINHLSALGFDGSHRSVGISCLVLKGYDVYLAQVGPSLAFIAHEGESRLIGGLELVTDPAAGAGDGEISDIRLFHSTVSPGDIVILASSSLGRALDVKRLGRVLQGQTAAQVRQSLHELWKASGSADNLSALIVEIGGTREQDPSIIREAIAQIGRSHLRPTRREASSKSGKVRQQEPSTEPASQSDDEDDDYPGAQGQLLGDRLVMFFEGTGSSLGDILRQWTLPGATRLRNLLVVATLLLLVGGCLLGGARLWQGRQLEATVLNLVEEAEAKEQMALASVDLDLKRRLLMEAEALAQRAEDMRKDDPSLRAVRERIQRQLDSLTEVARVHAATLLVDLASTGGSGEARKIIYAQGSLYVLDTGAQVFHRYRLKDSGQAVETDPQPAILRKGDTVGYSVVGDLVAASLIPAGGLRERTALVCLDNKGVLYEYEPSRGLSALRLLDAGLSEAAPMLGGYAGNLYLLDAKSSRLLWYPPTSTGFDRFVYNYLGPGVNADFATAVALAVDSNLYVLHKTGNVDRFYGGRPQPFEVATPDAPLKRPTSLSIGSVTKSLYVLDSGNQRVVEYGSDGRFRRQIKSGSSDNPLGKARDLAVDEQHGKLYLLAGSKVYALDLN